MSRRAPQAELGFFTARPAAGVDEAGRGPLAGPVVAAAVILPDPCPVEGLADSKKLSARQRETLAVQVRSAAVAWAVAWADAGEIDRLNILHASMLAMRRAVQGLPVQPAHVQVDGNRCPRLGGHGCTVEAIVGGDARVAAISAASILAKVARDAMMQRLHQQFPGYGFDAHKGYPTRAHLAALQEHGACPAHRRSFGPVATRVAAP